MERLKGLIRQAGNRPIVFLTGAGISAASGIPTFRGKEGYWTVGSTNYHPMDLATNQAFSEMPDEVWCWYLFRRTVCRKAEPNPAHLMLAELEERLRQRFLLVTQNVDGLHLRAGNSLARTYQVHGNIDYMRCWEECCLDQFPIPETIGPLEREMRLSDHQKGLLKCPRCQGQARPHVLWFDECYDEPRFRFNSSLKAALECGLLVTVGCSGSTNLPMRMAQVASGRGACLVDINPETNPFARMAQASGGLWFRERAGPGLTQIVDLLSAA